MRHHRITLSIAVAVSASVAASAAGTITQHGRAIVEYRSDEVSAVASYECSQRNHNGHPDHPVLLEPGRIIHDSAVTNLDQVAAGNLLFKSPSGKWNAGAHRLVLIHEQAKAELPITLQ